MSRKTLRVVLFMAISLAIIAGTFVSVQALSAVSRRDSKGMYVLSGNLVNPLKSQAAGEAGKPKLDMYRDPSDGGRDCESEADSGDL